MNVAPTLAAKAAAPPRGTVLPWGGPAALEVPGGDRYVK